MSDVSINGSCLCGAISYELTGNLGIFQYCHCSRCRKFTGSAFGANMIVRPDQFKWLKGIELVGRYEVAEAKYFATCFCQKCGSSLPWETKGGRSVVIPAGTLDSSPDVKPTHRLFCDSEPEWFEETNALERFEQMPH